MNSLKIGALAAFALCLVLVIRLMPDLPLGR